MTKCETCRCGSSCDFPEREEGRGCSGYTAATKLMRIMTFNCKRAELHGYKPTKTDKLIMLRSDGVHMQIQFTERYGHISATSTLRYGVGGFCFLDTKYSHHVYWDIVYLPVTAEEEALMWAKGCEMADARYFQKYEFAEALDVYFNEHLTVNGCIYGPNHVKYDFWRGAVFSYISKAKIIKPSKTKMVCNRAVTEVVLAGKPDAMEIVRPNEGIVSHQADYASMTPSEADAMFRNYCRDKC